MRATNIPNREVKSLDPVSKALQTALDRGEPRRDTGWVFDDGPAGSQLVDDPEVLEPLPAFGAGQAAPTTVDGGGATGVFAGEPADDGVHPGQVSPDAMNV